MVTALVLMMNAGDARSQSFREVSTLLDVESDPLATLFGASIVDINSDGLVDIYQPSRMYLQQTDGTFRHTMQEIGIDRDGYQVFGAIFADTDDDGFLDVFFMDLLADSSRFFSNARGLRYEHSNETVGIEIGGEIEGSIFADFNGDGPIDLFVGEEHGNNQLFLGSLEGVFTDATAGAGIVLPPHTYGAAAADYDEDGDLDIFIAACSPEPEYSVNLLFQNQGDGTFVDTAAFAGVDDDLGGWGVVWIDYDADGRLDIFVVNMPTADGRSGVNKLYRNLGDGRFEDVAAGAGVSGAVDELGLGAAAADFDNDGWIDLYVANLGFPDRLYMNNHDGTFTDLAADAGLTGLDSHRSVAVGDIDGDGWVDVFTGTEADPFNKLFFNEGGLNNYLTVSLRGSGGNGFGIGARLKLYIDGNLQMRDITAGDGMTSQNHALTAHFGLGESTSVDSLVISWPSGSTERYTGLDINRHTTIVEGVGLNDAPGVFSLSGPGDGSVFDFSEDVTVSWNPSEDSDDLMYTLAVIDESGQIYYEESGITSTSAVIYGFVTKAKSNEISYTWTVSATDGYSVRRASGIGSFLRVGSLSSESDELPEPTAITAVYPIPVSNALTVAFRLERPQIVEITVIDVLGRVVSRTVPQMNPAGEHVEHLDTSRLAPGAYFILLQGDRARSLKPIVVSR